MSTPTRSTPAIPIHLLYGSDEDGWKRAGAEMAKRLAPTDPMNLEVIDGRAETADEAIRAIAAVRAAILTYPFFGGGKLIWWKAVNFFDEKGVGRHESVKQALETLQPDLARVDGQSVTLLITALGLHRGRSFSKALLKVAQARAFDLPDLRRTSEDEIIFQIERRLKDAGLRPGPGAAERFYQATGVDTALWSREIEKLALFVGGGSATELTRAEIDRVISGTREVIIWDFCRAVLEGQGKLALSQLAALLAQEESEVGILVLLGGQIRLAALGAVLRENKLLKVVSRGSYHSAEVAPAGEAYLPRKKDGEAISTYALGQAARQSQRRPAQFWMEALETLYRAHQQIVSGQVDRQRILEWVVLEIVAGTRERVLTDSA